MGHINKLSRLLNRFKSNADGTMAVMWAVSLSAVVLAGGSAYDYSKVTSARSQSVATADMLALTAAVFIRDHNGDTPNSDTEGFRNNREYHLADIGVDIGVRTEAKTGDGKKEGPTFKIKYNYPEYGMVTAFIYGQTRPAFMGMVGINNVDFSASSTVSYEAKDLKDPASIGLVLDNSGSMRYDDGNGTERMTGLKTTVKNFMTEIEEIIDVAKGEDRKRGQNPQGENKYVRMNMMTYTVKSDYYGRDYEYITEHSFDWDTIPTWKINNMTADGGTNSSGAMARMKSRMSGEEAIHASKNGSKPLKYVIFMTDGVNNVTGVTNCRPAPGHYHWYNMKNGQISHGYKGNKNNWYYVWAREENDRDQYWDEQQECDDYSSYDAATIQSCNDMKADGVKIYSIGYALDPKPYDSDSRTEELKRANALLLNCSSGPDYFKEAANAQVLNIVFDKIGKDIIADSIRIKY